MRSSLSSPITRWKSAAHNLVSNDGRTSEQTCWVTASCFLLYSILFFHVFVFIDDWAEYTPYICGNSNRNEIKDRVTEQECKNLCSACVAIEYWSGGYTACFECFNKTERYHYTNTNDGSYPPHVFVKNWIIKEGIKFYRQWKWWSYAGWHADFERSTTKCHLLSLCRNRIFRSKEEQHLRLPLVLSLQYTLVNMKNLIKFPPILWKIGE